MTRNKLLGLAAVIVLASFATGCPNELLQAVQEDVERATNTDAPTGSISINSGAGYTQSANVTLSLSATAAVGTVDSMEVRNDAAFIGNWQPYAASLAWSLSSGDETKTVYVRYQDDSEKISSTYTDTIILDTVNPTVSSRIPASGAADQLRTVNARVNFSESMDQSTFTTSTVYLRIKGGATVPTTMTKFGTYVTLDPVSTNLDYGYDYTIVVTSGVKDLSGRAISNPGSTDFTVQRDYWEGLNGNDLPANAYDMTWFNSYDLEDFWIDFVPDQQEEEWSLPTGVHRKLALLESVDYYTIDVPAGMYYLEVDVFFTEDEATGTTVDDNPLAFELLDVGVNHNGHGMGGYIETIVSESYRLRYLIDISDAQGGPGIYTILVQEATSNYINQRPYNVRIRYGTGM